MTVKNILTVSALWVTASAAMATPLGWGDDITIFDRNSDGGNSWYSGSSDGRIDSNGVRTREDNEVEPGMAVGQDWDAEGFFQNEHELTIVAGFNMVDGYHFYGDHFTAGDLFIDINGDAEYGDIYNADTAGNQLVQNNYGYDYVFDIDWDAGIYGVYKLDSNSYTITADVANNQGSNAWQYDADSSFDEMVAHGTFDFNSYTSGEIDDYFLGGEHYAASGFDLAFLGDDATYVAHWTMSCGNDNLMGQGVTTGVAEPATIALFGLGLLGLGAIRRKQA